MPATLLTAENIRFIKKNRLKMSGGAMAEIFGVSKGVVNRYMRENGITAPKQIIKKWRTDAQRKPFTDEEDAYIKKYIRSFSIKEIAAAMGRTGSYVGRRSRELGLGKIIDERTQACRIKPGHVPANKGMRMSKELYKKEKHTFFKKGHQPINTLPAGKIYIRHQHAERGERPYRWIKLTDGHWQQYHRYKWEQKYGKVPPKHLITFKDGNTLNCSLKNLKLISFQDNMLRNSASTNLTDGYVAYSIATKKNPELVEDLKANKPLIELKRQSLLLNRAINEKQSNKNKAI